MIGWVITAAFLLLIVLLLLSPVKIRLSVDQEVTFRIRYLFFTLFRFPSRKEKKPKQQEEKPDRPDKPEEKKSFLGILKNFKENTGLYETIGDLLEIIKNILTRVKRLLKHVVLKKTMLDLVIATDDASKTAIQYGWACSAVYPIVNLLRLCVNFQPRMVSVRTDFEKNKPEFRLFTDAGIRLIYILTFVVSSAFYLLKLKIGEKKDECK